MSETSKKVEGKRLLITALIVVFTSAVVGGAVWLKEEAEIKRLNQTGSLTAISNFITTRCAANNPVSNEALLDFAKSLPGIEEAKIEKEDGVEKLVAGYTPAGQKYWADSRWPTDCSNVLSSKKDSVENLKSFCSSNFKAVGKRFTYVETENGEYGTCGGGDTTDGPGAILIAKKIDSEWTKIAITQDTIGETLCNQYKVPAQIDSACKY